MKEFNLIENLPYILFVIYVVCLLIQLFSTIEKRESNTIKKFAVGTQKYSVIVLLITILGTMIGPGFSYGAIEEFYQYGFGYTLCFLLVGLQFWLFSKFFAGKMHEISKENGSIVTLGGIVGLKYNKPAQFASGLLSLAFAIGLVAVLSYAGGKVLSDFLGIQKELATFIVIMFIAVYTFSGGIATIVRTDKINVCLILMFLLIGIGCGIYVFVSKDANLFSTIWEWGYTNTTKVKTPNAGWLNIAIAFLLGEIFIPVYSVRSMMTDDKKKTQEAFRWAAIIGVIWFIALTFIAIATHLLPESEKLSYLNLIDTVLSSNSFWAVLCKSIAIIGMIGVVVSTLDSILNAAGVSFSKDIVEIAEPIYKKIFKKKETENKSNEKKYHRYVILFITFIGFVCAIYANGIVSALLYTYSIWVPAIFCPIVYCLVSKNIKNKWTGLIGMIAGFCGWFAFSKIDAVWNFPMVYGIIISAIATFISERYKTSNN